MRTIETTRLRLRQWNDADVEPWADMNADPVVMEYFPEVTPREKSRSQAAANRERLEKNGYGWFVIERKDQPGFGGAMALDDIAYGSFKPAREIGWRLPTGMWGHGYATEAAQALADYAFTELQWPHIVAMTAVINERSQRVMNRIGMTRDPRDDFDHPRVAAGHVLKPHVLYRKSSPTAQDCPQCNSLAINLGVPLRLCEDCGLRF